LPADGQSRTAHYGPGILDKHRLRTGGEDRQAGGPVRRHAADAGEYRPQARPDDQVRRGGAMMGRIRNWLALVAGIVLIGLSLTDCAPVSADDPHTHVIRFDGGGRLGEYIDRYVAAAEAGDRYVIDGMCI